MRVLLVAAANAVSGGGERHVADLVRQLPSHGIEVGLACPPGGDLTALAKDRDVPVYAVEMDGFPWPVRRLALVRAIAAFRPDIVHAHGSRAAFHVRLADCQAEDRCLYTVHGIHVGRAGSFVRRKVLVLSERALRHRTAAFITVCESDLHTGTRLGIIDPARSTVIRNGIPLADGRQGKAPRSGPIRKETGISADAPLVLSVGRLHEQKDHATLLRAWATVGCSLPEARLVIIGSGPLHASLEALSASLTGMSGVRIVPPREDLASVYAEADVFVLSSRWEGLPYVILEAMSYALPVISTDVDGVPEAIEDGVSGLLVPPGDPDALAQALLALINDPARAHALGVAANERVVREFSLETMVVETCAVYRQILDTARAK